MHTRPSLNRFRTALSPAEWRTIMQTNFEGTALAVQQVGRRLVDSGKVGSIVLISSISGRTARPENAHYAASKAAVLSLVKSAAGALAPLIRVNGVCPGSVDTPMLNRHITDNAARARANLMQRTGHPTDIADAATFLLSDRASFITGQSLNVDGGTIFN